MENRPILDCEDEHCVHVATVFPNGHRFCFDHYDLYTRKLAQEECAKQGLDTPAKCKAAAIKMMKNFTVKRMP